MEDFLTAEEVAKILRISEDSVTRMLRQKKLPGYKVEGSWRVERQDLREYLAKRKNIQEEQ